LAFALSHLSTVERSLGVVGASLGNALVEVAKAPWERAQQRLREMDHGLKRIAELVQHLRTFSRLDEGERKRVSVRESIESVLTMLRHRLSERLSLVIDFGEPDEIVCYASLFNQAVMNLVSNAIDAVNARDEPGEIGVLARGDAGWFEVRVTDNGAGIPDAVRERVFEPFFTTKPVGQGMGLGLSISYSIAERHGGTLELLPRAGGGTVAVFRFPLVPV
jgi:two-component system NtrC family sensor kinase